jgi:ketosteroid isomerase-like protein
MVVMSLIASEPNHTTDPALLLQEVIATERAWVEAHRKLDIAQLAALMAEEYAVITQDGRVLNKAEDLASYSTGDRHWDFAESDQYDLRLYGESAILIGRWRARGVNGGYYFDYAAHFVAHYVTRDGRWQMTFAQSTPIAGMTSSEIVER